VIDAPVLVALANAGRPRRPPGARRAVTDDPFEHAESATRMLGTFVGRPVDAGEVDEVRRLAHEASRIADSLVGGNTPSLRGLNRLAADCPGRAELRSTPAGGLEAVVRWESGAAAAVLARRIIEELGGIDPGRLRRCARPECGLIFYDCTRSGTQRWHSEVPCGWRERQRRRRAQ
jgi:predicted RNA-binding Zn ribbon-like protein